jgi:uncharacterized membrane protein
MNINKFLSKEQKEKIIQAIGAAEKQTSGEIRVHLEKRCKIHPLDRAGQVFQYLKMDQTQLRNGALIYLAVADKKFAIFGDEGINEAVPDNFWEDVKEEMRGYFAKGDFADGVILAINHIGEKLREFFPYKEDDINELPDDLSIGE